MPIMRELEKIIGPGTGVRNLPAGAELFRQGEVCATCFGVASGWIALSKILEDGGCQIVDFVVPGGFLGSPFWSQASTCYSARCLTPVQVHCYSEAQISMAISRSPQAVMLLGKQAVLGEHRAHDHLINVGLRGARERVANLLLELYVRLHGHLPNRAGEILPLPLTQNHIGQAVGLTGVHVCRTLHILREQGIVQLVRNELHVLDPHAFVRAVGIADFRADLIGASVRSLSMLESAIADLGAFREGPPERGGQGGAGKRRAPIPAFVALRADRKLASGLT